MVECIGQWQRFEVALNNVAAYEDPYRDVRLEVQMTRPDGTTCFSCGFFDGGTVWKLRWMPDEPGTWQYRAQFTDDSGGVEGSFECLPSDLPGMIAADEENPLWFGFRGAGAKNNGHFLMRSLHVGDSFFAANMPDERRTAFLDWAQSMGYNTLSIASHYLNRAEPGRGQGWVTPKLWPLEAGEYQKTERILDDLAERRMIVFPFGGFFGRGSAYPQTEADQELYVRYVLARFGAYWNILLNVSGPEPLLVKEGRVWIEKPELERMGRMIRSLDPYHHILTVHNQTGDDAFLNEDWVDFGTLQGPKTTNAADLYAGLIRNRHPRRPLYAQETLWSGNKYHPQYSDEELRRNAIILHMAGAAINFIDNGGPDPSQIGDSSSGFSGTLNLTDRRQWRHEILRSVWDFFSSLPFSLMRPCPDLVPPTVYCLAEPGKQYLLYLPAPEEAHLQVESGQYAVEWIDARDTANRQAGGETTDGVLKPPSEGEDWFAYLTRIL